MDLLNTVSRPIPTLVLTRSSSGPYSRVPRSGNLLRSPTPSQRFRPSLHCLARPTCLSSSILQSTRSMSETRGDDAGPSNARALVCKAPEHLNSVGLRIEYGEGKGRGVYGKPSHSLPTPLSQVPKTDEQLVGRYLHKP